MLLFTLLLMAASLALVIYGATISTDEAPSVLLIVGIVLLCITWIPLLGLKILKPQEALVITLFGNTKVLLRATDFSGSIHSLHLLILQREQSLIKAATFQLRAIYSIMLKTDRTSTFLPQPTKYLLKS